VGLPPAASKPPRYVPQISANILCQYLVLFMSSKSGGVGVMINCPRMTILCSGICGTPSLLYIPGEKSPADSLPSVRGGGGGAMFRWCSGNSDLLHSFLVCLSLFNSCRLVRIKYYYRPIAAIFGWLDRHVGRGREISLLYELPGIPPQSYTSPGVPPRLLTKPTTVSK
jgi:hypothetical protein